MRACAPPSPLSSALLACRMRSQRWRAEVCAVVARADAHGGTGLDAAPAAALDRVARVAAVRANIIFRRSDKWR